VKIDNHYVNFSNFGIAMITLFRCSTGEDWYKIMYDTSNPVLCSDGTQSCGQIIAPLFWIAFMMVAQYIMVNMLLSVMIQEFERNYFGGEELSLDKFKENVRDFDAIWVKLSKKYDGQKIKSTTLIKLFCALKKPLGFLKKPLGFLDPEDPEDNNRKDKQKEIAKHIMKMHLQCDRESCVYFNDVLFAALKRAYEKYITKEADDAMLEFVRNEEYKTLRLIQKIKKKNLRRNKSMGDETVKNSFNPLLAFLYFRMGLAAWKNYVKELEERKLEAANKGVEYIPSSSESSTGSDFDEDEDDYSDYSRSEEDEDEMEEIPEGDSSVEGDDSYSQDLERSIMTKSDNRISSQKLSQNVGSNNYKSLQVKNYPKMWEATIIKAFQMKFSMIRV